MTKSRGIGREEGLRRVRAARWLSAMARFWLKVDTSHGEASCWEWQGKERTKKRGGYGRLSVDGKPILAHRYSWLLHGGKLESNERVLHRCDNPLCVNPQHLFIGTQLDNIEDARRKGRMRRRLNPIIAAQIKCAGGSYVEIAEAFGVSRATVRDIRLGRTWRDV